MMGTNIHHHYLFQKISKKRQSDYHFNQKTDFDYRRCLGLTLTMRKKSKYGERLDLCNSTKNYRFFMNRLQGNTIRIRSKDDPRRIQNFPVLERGKNEVLHYHVLMEIPDKYLNRRDEFKEWIKDSWIKTPFGLWEMKIDPLYNKNGWMGYITKFRGKDDEVDVGNLHWVG